MRNITLVEKRTIAEGTMAFNLERPTGFKYLAGQTIDLTLIHPPEMDAQGPTRTFSIVSAPHEPRITVAMRMRDTAFKRTLKEMREGAPLSYKGPFGSFTLHENAARPAVFLAGGIGVTPFRSMIRDVAARALPHAITFFYSNRHPEGAAFLDEFQAFATTNPRFAFVPTMTNPKETDSSWNGERGYIDARMLKRHLPEGSMPIYYLAGPQTMVTAMRALLAGGGVSSDDIRFEEFVGY